MNSNILKLTAILGTGILILVIGFLVQRKMLAQKKLEEKQMYANYSSNESEDYGNDTIKNYILQYKDTYSRESLKSALIGSGNSEEEVEKYLDKFY